MNNKYFTRNFHVTPLINDFKYFHDYLIEYHEINKVEKYNFDIVNLSNEDKIKMLADCTYELSMFKNYLLTTNQNIKVLEDFDTKLMYIRILDLMNILKPYVLETEFLKEMSLRSFFTRAVNDVEPLPIKPKTKNKIISDLLDYFYNKDKEYETKSTFYTAAENKIVEKHYTEDIWFIVGLKFADGTLYDNKDKFKYQSELIRFVFSEDYHKSVQNYISKSFDGFNKAKKRNIGNDAKNIFDRPNAKIELKRVYDYCIENGIKMHSMFIENYLLVQEF